MRTASKINWYLSRLRNMSTGEVAHRILEAKRQRTGIHRQNLPTTQFVNRRDNSSVTRLLCEIGEPGDKVYQDQIVDGILDRGEVTILGSVWKLPSTEWNTDQNTGYQWPSSAAHKIDYRHSISSDPKWIWELNRLQFLVPMAASYGRGYRPEELNAEAGRILKSWTSSNTDGKGPSWASGIEVALRLISLTIAVETFKFSSELMASLSEDVAAHCSWLLRFPSRYSSANNHRVAELAGLLIACEFWNSQIANSTELQRELTGTMASLFALDGVGLEQSPNYAGFAIEMAALAANLCTWRNETVRTDCVDICRRGIEFLSSVSERSGDLLRFGDDDEGVVVAGAFRRESYLKILSAIAGIEVPKIVLGLRIFSQGGYSVARLNEVGGETVWLFDHGPLGFGQIAAHGHADALSLTMSSNGVQWLADAGTYRYHGDNESRTYFRSSRAHNAPFFAGQDSSVMTGNFNWSSKDRAEGQLISADSDGHSHLFKLSAYHGGYQRRLGNRIFRKFSRVGEGQYLIEDKIERVGKSKLESGFLMHPSSQVSALENGWEVTNPGSNQTLRIVADMAEPDYRLRVDQDSWYSVRFGEKQRTVKLTFDSLGTASKLKIRITLTQSKDAHEIKGWTE